MRGDYTDHDMVELLEAAKDYKAAMEAVLDKMDFGSSFLGAEQIAHWNESAIALDRAIAKAEEY